MERFKIYLSPSTQRENISPHGVSEEELMNVIADSVEHRLRLAGRFTVFRNRPGMSVAAIIRASDMLVGDRVDSVHLALHASDGPGGGTRTFVYKKGTRAERLARPVHGEVVKALKLRDRGVQSCYELGRPFFFSEVVRPMAASALIQIASFQNPVEVELLRTQAGTIGEAIATGILKFFGLGAPPA